MEIPSGFSVQRTNYSPSCRGELLAFLSRKSFRLTWKKLDVFRENGRSGFYSAPMEQSFALQQADAQAELANVQKSITDIYRIIHKSDL
jgi:hypothetical protein